MRTLFCFLVATAVAAAQTDVGANVKLKDGEHWYTDGTTVTHQFLVNHTFTGAYDRNAVPVHKDVKFEVKAFADTMVEFTFTRHLTAEGDVLPECQLDEMREAPIFIPKDQTIDMVGSVKLGPPDDDDDGDDVGAAKKTECSYTVTVKHLPLTSAAAGKLREASKVSANAADDDFDYTNGEFVGYSFLWTYVACMALGAAAWLMRFAYNLMCSTDPNASGRGMTNNML